MLKIKKFKERLQFTGWLQYILTGVVGTLVLLFGIILWFINLHFLAYPLIAFALLLYVTAIVDIVTIKFKVHPKESLPKRKEELDLIDLMLSRKSCRSFQTTKMDYEDHKELMNYVAFESQEGRKCLFQDSGIRFEYISATINVWPVVNGSEFLVAIAPKTYNRQAIIDVGYSLQKIVIHATGMGLATCWIGPGADQGSIEKALGKRFDSEKDHIICVCAVGYASKHLPFSTRVIKLIQHRRLPLASLFFEGRRFENALKITQEPFLKYSKVFEACRWSPSSFNGQTTRCVGRIQEDKQQLEMDFYATTNSKYYAPVALGIWCANWEMGCNALGIKGNFIIHSELCFDEKLDASQQLPRYDISWLEESN